MKALVLLFLIFIIRHPNIFCKKDDKAKDKEDDKKQEEKKIGKKITDYTDSDIHKLLDQWNENDEEYEEEDDDAPWKKSPPKIDMQKIMSAGGDKEAIFKASKKGQPIMMFATVAGKPTQTQTEKISSMWQTGLQNANIQVTRYVVADDRVLFQVNDGSLAFQIKDFLVEQDSCVSVSFDNMDFPGKGKKDEL